MKTTFFSQPMVALRSTVQSHPTLLIRFILSTWVLYKFLLYRTVLYILYAWWRKCEFSWVMVAWTHCQIRTLCFTTGMRSADWSTAGMQSQRMFQFIYTMCEVVKSVYW